MSTHNPNSPYGNVTQFFSMMKLAARLSREPQYIKTICNELALNERTFYRKVRDLKEIGVEIRQDLGIWYVESVSEQFRDLFREIELYQSGKDKKNERVRKIKQRRISAHSGANSNHRK